MARNAFLLFSPFYRSANVLFHLFPRKSVNYVMNQSKQQTLSFIVCRCPRFRQNRRQKVFDRGALRFGGGDLTF